MAPLVASDGSPFRVLQWINEKKQFFEGLGIVVEKTQARAQTKRSYYLE